MVRLRLHDAYPQLTGLLLGTLQTGLFFGLTFTLSSSFGTYLLVTLCWLLGSALGVTMLARLPLPLRGFLALSLMAYAASALLLLAQPFNSALWPLYAGLVGVSGVYAGVFFARLSPLYRAGTLFFRENNGFIGGLILGTLGFMLAGRMALWALPLALGLGVAALGEPPRAADKVMSNE